MNITIYAVGKIKEKFYTDAIAEYAKRLSRYCKLEIIQVADEKTPDKASEAEELQIKDKEGKRILEQIKDGAFVIVLAINGNMLDSVELAERIDKLGIGGVSQLVFVIGGSLGLSEAVLSRARELGVSERTLMIAKKNLGVISEKRGGQWYWHLPEQGCKDVTT